VSGWLLDTNVLSESRKAKRSPEVTNWIGQIEIAKLFTSVVTIAELRYGAGLQSDQLAQVEIFNWIDSKIRPQFLGRILGIDENVLLNWRILSRRNQVSKSSAPPVDLLIAAIAHTHGLKIATRDVAPFVACGIPTLNPWTGERFNGA
jgi:toxin FitB